MTEASHKLDREIRAARTLRAELSKIDGIDVETMADTIEGETALAETIAAAVREIDEDRIIVDGIKARIAELSERLSRVEDRVALKTGLIEQAMMIGEIAKLNLPTATLFLAARARQIEIRDESEIPSQFYVQQAPKLDKAALTRELRAAAERLSVAEADHAAGNMPLAELVALRSELSIPGAVLAPETRSLSIRRK